MTTIDELHLAYEQAEDEFDALKQAERQIEDALPSAVRALDEGEVDRLLGERAGMENKLYMAQVRVCQAELALLDARFIVDKAEHRRRRAEAERLNQAWFDAEKARELGRKAAGQANARLTSGVERKRVVESRLRALTQDRIATVVASTAPVVRDMRRAVRA